MDKKAESKLPMWIVAGAIVVLVLYQMGYIGTPQAAAPATTTVSPTGQIQIAPVTAINPSDTVTLTTVVKDEGLKAINTTYRAANATVLLNGQQWKTTNIAVSSAGTAITGIPVNTPFTVIFQGAGSASDTGVDTFYLVTKDYPQGLIKSDTLEQWVLPYGVLSVQAKNITSGEGSSGLANSVTVTGGNITSATYQEFELRAQAAAYNGFGDKGIIVACNRLGVEYDVKTSMTKTTLSSKMAQANKKYAYSANVQRVSDNVVSLGTIGFALKAGQTAKPINCTFYDRAQFKSIDGKTVLTGTEMDDTSNTDVGGGQASLVFGVYSAADINT